MTTESYLNKNISYFINPRHDLISLMPTDKNQKVLEVGMGGGDTLIQIKKQNLALEVSGIDLVELPGTNQKNPLIDKIYFFDLEKENLPFAENYFDTIIAGDVLEHLVNPWEVLQKLTTVLKVGGCLLISLPNIRDIYALYSILFKGSFAYTSHGIFDKTHMRFFCKKDMINLVKSVEQLKIEEIMPIQNFGTQNYKRKIFNKLTLKIFEEFTTSQYLIRLLKS
ncbi:MAG: methyltransferase domain-containing protein [Ferruginibacter sp.]